MRFSFVHVFTVLLIRNFCFSQFHQDDYDIVHEKINVIEVNKAVVQYINITVFKYNDTLKMKAINLTVTVKPILRKNILLTFVVFKKVQTIFRPFPIPNMTLDLCEEYRMLGERNPFGIKTAIGRSNFRGCPVQPGTYHLDTFILEQDKFPPHAPVGQYRLNIHAAVDDDIYGGDVEYYGAVVKKNKKKH